jgi:ABC-type xylose transport system permease subunit
MADQPIYRPVFKALHRPLTVCGVDRASSSSSLVMGGAHVQSFLLVLGGVLVFLGLYGFSLWATSARSRHAPYRSRFVECAQTYDPGKHERFDVEVAPW